MIEILTPESIPHMLELQRHCSDQNDRFTPTSENGYRLSFLYDNFCLGIWNEKRDALVAFMNCTLPTGRASRNLGRGRIADDQLDRVGHMNTLLIHRDHRRHGIGKAMVLYGLNELCERGAAYIYTITSPSNTVSQHLLLSLGFVNVDDILLNGQQKRLFCFFADDSPTEGTSP